MSPEPTTTFTPATELGKESGDDERTARGRILLVDDEPDILESMRIFLRAQLPEVDVMVAATAQEALDLLRIEAFDLVVTDQRMPGKTGLDLLREAHRIAPKVPKLMLTAYPDLQLAVKAVNEGNIAGFFTKPVDPEALAERIQELLVARDRDRALQRSVAQDLQRYRELQQGHATERAHGDASAGPGTDPHAGTTRGDGTAKA